MDLRKKAGLIVGIIFLLVFLPLFYAFFIEPSWIEIDSISVDVNVPQPVKFILISDFHLANENYAKEIVSKVNSTDADFVLIAGDFLSGLEEKEKTISFLPLIKFNKPAFAVLGNHDYWMSLYSDAPDFELANKVEKILEENEINVLRNESIELNSINPEFNGIFVVGIDDLWAEKAKPEMLENFEGFPIALAHEPETIEFINNAGFGVAGHTHGGQAFPLTLRMDSGLYNKKFPYHVSRGLGTSTLNARFLCRPEITVIELK